MGGQFSISTLGQSDSNQFSRDETRSGTKGMGGLHRAGDQARLFLGPLSLRFHLGNQHKSNIELNILSLGY